MNLGRESSKNGLNYGVPSTSFAKSLRTTYSYLKSASATAVRTAGASVAQVAAAVVLSDDESSREQVRSAKFDVIEVSDSERFSALLVTYINGFQIWNIQEAQRVREVVSRRDGPVSQLCVIQMPLVPIPESSPLAFSRPHICLVCPPSALNAERSGNAAEYLGTRAGFPVQHGVHYDSVTPSLEDGRFAASCAHTILKFYSLSTHQYVHTLKFRSEILSVKCNQRVLVVALSAQVYMLSSSTLEMQFSVLTYPAPVHQPTLSWLSQPLFPLALGARWLAYASNQPVVSSPSGRVSPQQYSPSVSPSTSPGQNSRGAALMAHYARESGKQLANGIVTLGDMGLKTVSKYWSEMVVDDYSSPGVAGNGSYLRGRSVNRPDGMPPSLLPGAGHHDPDFAGSVIVRDVVNKMVVAQFRAHSSPLSAMMFDPSGTLLVTASICGHSINVFRLTPPGSGQLSGMSEYDASTSHVHLYRLYRGLTSAVIHGISFSNDSTWVAISSSRGTTHLFAISPFGGPVGPHTHVSSGELMASQAGGPHPVDIPVPWWSSRGPLHVSKAVTTPPPHVITLTVTARIRNGNSGWCGNVTAAAAAAAGVSNVNAPTVIASTFHDGGDCFQEPAMGDVPPALQSQLWIFVPSGHLVRYFLKPYASTIDEQIPMGSSPASDYSESAVQIRRHSLDRQDPNFHCERQVQIGYTGQIPAHDLQLKLAVEQKEKWDVCRRNGWADREEALKGNLGRRSLEDETLEALQRVYMSHAEVQTLRNGVSPIWARKYVHFQVLTPPANDEGKLLNIEDIPTRTIEIRRHDLIPLSERHVSVTHPGRTEGLGSSPCERHVLPSHGVRGYDWPGHREMRMPRTPSTSSSSGSDGGSTAMLFLGDHMCAPLGDGHVFDSIKSMPISQCGHLKNFPQQDFSNPLTEVIHSEGEGRKCGQPQVVDIVSESPSDSRHDCTEIADSRGTEARNLSFEQRSLHGSATISYPDLMEGGRNPEGNLPVQSTAVVLDTVHGFSPREHLMSTTKSGIIPPSPMLAGQLEKNRDSMVTNVGRGGLALTIQGGETCPPQPGPNGQITAMSIADMVAQNGVEHNRGFQPSPGSTSATPCSSFESTQSPLRKFPRHGSPLPDALSAPQIMKAVLPGFSNEVEIAVGDQFPLVEESPPEMKQKDVVSPKRHLLISNTSEGRLTEEMGSGLLHGSDGSGICEDAINEVDQQFHEKHSRIELMKRELCQEPLRPAKPIAVKHGRQHSTYIGMKGRGKGGFSGQVRSVRTRNLFSADSGLTWDSCSEDDSASSMPEYGVTTPELFRTISEQTLKALDEGSSVQGITVESYRNIHLARCENVESVTVDHTSPLANHVSDSEEVANIERRGPDEETDGEEVQFDDDDSSLNGWGVDICGLLDE